MRNSKKKIVCLYAMAVMSILAAILFDEEMPTGIDSVSALVISVLLFVIAFLGFIHFGAKEGEEDEEIIKEAKRLRERDKEVLERGLRPALIDLETGQDVFDTISRSEAHRFSLAVNICESNKQPTGKNFRVKWIGHVIALHIPTPYHKGGLELRWEDVKAHKEQIIAAQIAERHNKYGVTLTDPRTGRDLLAGMTEKQRKKYIEFKKKDA